MHDIVFNLLLALSHAVQRMAGEKSKQTSMVFNAKPFRSDQGVGVGGSMQERERIWTPVLIGTPLGLSWSFPKHPSKAGLGRGQEGGRKPSRCICGDA